MDRVIEVKVRGNYVTKDNNMAGVQGESNATALRIDFDEGWDGFAKTITWWDAKGENPTQKILTADQVTEERTYLTFIPGEALTVQGQCTFGIDGYINGKRQKSVYSTMVVQSDGSGADVPTGDPTPTQAEQLQVQIDSIMGDIARASSAADAKEAAEQSAADALASAAAADAAAKSAAGSAAASDSFSKLSESWAVGGTGMRAGENVNNAKYWAEEAIKAVGGGVTSFNGRTGVVLPAAGDYTADMVGAAVRPNLLDNAHFYSPHLIDQRQGYVVPPDTAYYSDTGLATQAGTVSAYTAAVYVNGTYGTITVSGTTYYVPWTAAVRGYTKGNMEYGIDRWTAGNATLLIKDDCVTLISGEVANYKRIMQKSEGTLRAKQIYTISMLCNVNAVSGNVVLRPCTALGGVVPGCPGVGFVGSGWTNGLHCAKYTFTPQEDVDEYGIEVLAQNTINDIVNIDVYAWKLEKGPTQTLARQLSDGTWELIDQPPKPAAALAECQRYQVELIDSTNSGDNRHGVGIGIGYANSAALILVDLPVTTRTHSPALEFHGNLALYDGQEFIQITNIRIYNANNTKNKVLLAVDAENVVVGQTYILRSMDSSARILLDYNP